MSTREKYVVAVVGGAVAGSEAAAQFLAAGIPCVLIEQNERPYGKIEDGLPKWHVKLRDQEYAKIDTRLDHPHLHFVPQTRLGEHLRLDDVLSWGFSAVVLANGAWRDRPLPLEGVDAYVGKGLYYQNPFTYWFNHYDEKGYSGPQYDVADAMIVVGGGLASIDIVKMLQLELVGRALKAKGHAADVVELEHSGVPKALEKLGVKYEDLGLKGCTLFYRRTAEDMPLADPPDNPTPEQLAKSRTVSAKLLQIAMKKYLFNFQPQRAPAAPIVEDGRLVGLKFNETQIEGKKVTVLKDVVHEVRGPLTISSIGSIPLPIPDLPMKGETYDIENEDTGKLRGPASLYAVGNAVTGKGNINVSYKHARAVTAHMLETYLVGDSGALDVSGSGAAETAANIAQAVKAAAPLDDKQRADIMTRVRQLQTRAGFEGGYKPYIEKHRPPPRV